MAIDYARQHGGEIINADAFQLYRGLEVLTASPTAEDLALVQHHLYGMLASHQAADAQQFCLMAQSAIEEINSRGKLAIVTGGSGLYLKFLTHGAAPLPRPDAALREELNALSLDQLVSRLIELDPLEASRTALKNRRFVSRAVEICLLTGGKASALRDGWHAKTTACAAQLQGIVIHRDRAQLHQRIAARTRIMLENGAIDEVASLKDPSNNLTKAIGYAQIRDFLDGKIDLATCEERIVIATRQYAKRQETWFRREQWLTPREQ